MTTAIVNRSGLREQHAVSVVSKVMDSLQESNETIFNAIGEKVKISKEQFEDKTLYTIDTAK